MKILISIILNLVVYSAFSQSQMLNPCFDIALPIKENQDAYSKLINKIDSTLGDTFEIRYLVRPSFDSEFLFQIEKIGSSVIVKSAKLNKNMYYEKNANSIFLDVKQTTLNYSTFLRLDLLFKKATESSNQRDIIEFEGEDGINYNFYRMNNEKQITCGHCWSPSPDYLTFELVKICNDIYEFGNGIKIDIDNVNSRIDNLHERIK